MCQACRGLVEASTRTCPLCGRESVPRLRISVGEKGAESFFSLLLLGINIALFIMMAAVDLSNGTEGISVMNTPSPSVFYDFGGRSISLILHGQWWRLVTPNFLHLGLMHLMFNSVALYYVGPQVEGLYGSQKFIFIYLATGIFSNVASFTFWRDGAGASGAIFGLIGLLAVYGHRRGGSFGAALRRQMLIWAAFGIVYGFVMGADNVAHVGGFIAGAALGYIIPGEQPNEARSALLWNIAAIGCALIVVVSFGMVAKNYGASQKMATLDRSSESAQRLEQALVAAFRWTGPGDGDPDVLASRLKAAAASFQRAGDLDQPSKEICDRLSDLANKRAALLEAAKTNPGAITPSNSSYAEVDAARQEYLAWWRGEMRELGLE